MGNPPTHGHHALSKSSWGFCSLFLVIFRSLGVAHTQMLPWDLPAEEWRTLSWEPCESCPLFYPKPDWLAPPLGAAQRTCAWSLNFLQTRLWGTTPITQSFLATQRCCALLKSVFLVRIELTSHVQTHFNTAMASCFSGHVT